MWTVKLCSNKILQFWECQLMKIVLRDRAELSTNPATRLTECVSSVDPDILILTTELSISMSIHCMPACRCISDSAVFQMCLAESCTSTAPSATGALVHLMCQFINLKWQHHILVLYVADLLQLIKHHQLVPHGYAADTQIYGFADHVTWTSSPTKCLPAQMRHCRG